VTSRELAVLVAVIETGSSRDAAVGNVPGLNPDD
jgi:hypothetical protein